MAPPAVDDEASRRKNGKKDDAEFLARADIRAKVADIRREIENLQASLTNIETATGDGGANLASVLVAEAKVLERENGPFEVAISALRDKLNQFPRSARGVDGAVTSIQNNWERAVDNWPQVDKDGNAPPADKVKVSAATARSWLKQANYEAAMTNVPSDLRSWISKQRVLKPLDFHTAFARDLPDKDDRDRMLKYLASAPDSYRDAFIDVETGKIYRTSAAASEVLLAYLLFAAVVIGGGLIVAGMSYYNVFGLTRDAMTTWLAAYAGIVLGAAAHMIIDVFKAKENEKVFTNVGVRAVILWAYSEQTQVLKALAPLFLGPVILAQIGDSAPLTGIFLGYSFDSVFDLVLKRFDKTMAVGSDELLKKEQALAT